jgi:chromosome segregation ATPase
MDPDQQNPLVAAAEQTQTESPTPTQPAPEPATTPAPAAPKKSKKGLVIGLSIGGGLLVIGAIVLVLLLTLGGGISKADYREAQEYARSVAEKDQAAQEDILSLVNALSSSDISQSDLDDITSTLKTYVSDIKSGIDKLGDYKAIKDDEEAAGKYKTLQAAYDDYDKYCDLIIEFYEEVLPPFIKMMSFESKFSSITDLDQVSSLVTELKSIADELDDVNVSNSSIKDAIEDISEALTDMADLLQDMIDDPSNASSAYSKLSSLTTKLQTGSTSLTKPLTDRSSITKLSTAFSDLGGYLTDKANGDK